LNRTIPPDDFKMQLNEDIAPLQALSYPGPVETPEEAQGEVAAPHVTAEGEPRWLDSDERATWMSLMSLLIKLPAALDAQLQRDSGLSHFEYTVLAGLSEMPGGSLRMSVLAALADGSLPRLSQVVARLERRGLVRRTPDPDDGRYTLATLTDAGRATVTEAAPGHVETVRNLVFDPLTKGKARQLRDICHRILTALDPGDRCFDHLR
jgi:DNA-binding MarR family transcriptional regulator